MVYLELKEEVEKILMDDEDIVVEMEDVGVEGSDPISKLLEYIPPCRGKVKAPKDIYESKVTLYIPLLPEKIVFEGPHLGHVPFLKLEDWDLVDIEHFPHLVTDQLMYHVFHKIVECHFGTKEVAERCGQGRPAKPVVGATLQPHAHHNDRDQVAIVLGARWVSMDRGVNTHY